MLQVLVAGLIALGTKWILEGGISRRDRHVIREELELADLLGDRPEAAQLRVIAHRRLERYLRPPLRRRMAPAMVAVAPYLLAMVFAVAIVSVAAPDDTDSGDSWAIGLSVGALSAILAQTLQWLVGALLRLRATRARIAANQPETDRA